MMKTVHWFYGSEFENKACSFFLRDLLYILGVSWLYNHEQTEKDGQYLWMKEWMNKRI